MRRRLFGQIVLPQLHAFPFQVGHRFAAARSTRLEVDVDSFHLQINYGGASRSVIAKERGPAMGIGDRIEDGDARFSLELTTAAGASAASFATSKTRRLGSVAARGASCSPGDCGTVEFARRSWNFHLQPALVVLQSRPVGP